MKDKLKRFMDSSFGKSLWTSICFTLEITIFTGVIFLAYNYLSGKIIDGMTVAQYQKSMSLFQDFEKPESIVFRNSILLIYACILVETVYACIRSVHLVERIEIKKLKKKIQELEAYQE